MSDSSPIPINTSLPRSQDKAVVAIGGRAVRAIQAIWVASAALARAPRCAAVPITSVAAASTAAEPPSSPSSPSSPWALLAGLVTVMLWSTNFPIIRYGLQVYSPTEVAFLRTGFAALALLGVAVLAVAMRGLVSFARVRLPAGRDVPAFLLFALLGMALSSLGLTYGLQTVGAGAGAFVIGMIPVFAALLAWHFLGEQLRWVAWAGIAISLCGVVVIGLGEGGDTSGEAGLNRGVAFLVGSAAVQAVFYVFQKPYLGRYSPLEITAFVVWGGTVWLGWVAPGAVLRMLAVPWPHTAAIAFQGVFPVAVAFVLWSVALRRARAAHVTSLVYLMPVLALGLAYFWLGELPSAVSIAGGVLALGGVAILNLWGH